MMITMHKKRNTGSIPIFFLVVFLFLAGGSYAAYRAGIFSNDAMPEKTIVVASSTTIKPATKNTKATTTTKIIISAPKPKVVVVVLPKISSISFLNKTASTAIISWKTNVPAIGQVFYDTQSMSSGNYSSSSAVEKTLTTDHSVSISGFVSGHTYYYQVQSIDSLGNKVTSAERTFTDAAVTISVPKLSDISDTGATISWNTNLETKGKIAFDIRSSPSGFYNNADMPVEENFNIAHANALTGLLPNTKYYYRIIVFDRANNKVISPEYSFDSSFIYGIQVGQTYYSSVSITWITSIAAKSEIRYGTQGSSAGIYPLSASENSLTGYHSLTLPNLDPHTKYYYRIIATDSLNKKTISIEYSFTTGS